VTVATLMVEMSARPTHLNNAAAGDEKGAGLTV
jgi:hypothetical protein